MPVVAATEDGESVQESEPHAEGLALFSPGIACRSWSRVPAFPVCSRRARCTRHVSERDRRPRRRRDRSVPRCEGIQVPGVAYHGVGLGHLGVQKAMGSTASRAWAVTQSGAARPDDGLRHRSSSRGHSGRADRVTALLGALPTRSWFPAARSGFPADRPRCRRGPLRPTARCHSLHRQYQRERGRSAASAPRRQSGPGHRHEPGPMASTSAAAATLGISFETLKHASIPMGGRYASRAILPSVPRVPRCSERRTMLSG